MPDFILITGDQAVFQRTFGTATVETKPGKLRGSSRTTMTGKKLCVAGDEKKVRVPGCSYKAPPYTIPGTGTLKISNLGADQKAKKTFSGGKPVLLKGSQFTAVFQVDTKAKDPNKKPPEPDPMSQYTGSGTFITSNVKYRVT